VQHLRLRCPSNAAAAQPDTASLQHLSRLCTLRADTLPPGAVLPSSLTHLSFCAQAHNFEGGAGLRALSLSGASTSTQLWEQLPSLTQLHALTVDRLASCSPGALQECFASVAAATQLRSLALAPKALSRKGWDPKDLVRQSTLPACPLGGLQLHQHLQKLRALESLRMAGLDVQPADAVHLTCCTGLTDLEVVHCPSLGDLAAVSLACRLTGLRRLVLELWAHKPNILACFGTPHRRHECYIAPCARSYG
jgi:hypothetical protein